MQKNKNKMQTGFSKIVILIVILTILSGVLVRQALEERREQQRIISEIPIFNIGSNIIDETIVDETADWQTYRNEEWGFEVGHPNGWIVEEKPLLVYPDAITITVEFRSPAKDKQFSIAVRPKLDAGMILEAYNISSDTDINIDGAIGSIITATSQKSGSSESTFALIIKGDYLYQIYKDGILLNSVLSTFKFID